MEKQRRTFLSYSRANKDFALKLAKELKSEGFPVWLDQLDIPLGARWDVEVEKALIECEIFMIIITKDSISSENVLDEIGYAIDSGKRFLPVLLERCNIPLRLRRFQYVDFTNKSFDEGVETAKDLLRSLNAQDTLPRKDLAEGAPAKQAIESNTADPAAPTTTMRLRREKLEQEMRFKEEQAKLLQEKAALEKKLEEERSTNEKIAAIQNARTETPLAPARPRSKLIMLLGLSVLVMFVAGLAITRMLAPSASTETPTEPPVSSTESSPAEEVAAAIPVTSNESAIPTTELPAPTVPPTEAATATSSAPLPEISDEQGVSMVLVPEGDFVMGSDRGNPDEQPIHTVYLDAFYIDKFEVTNRLYKACVDDGQCEPPWQTYFFVESPNRMYYGNSQYDNYPVVYVDWNMANAYCEWRGARLPTEAEWEKAARGTDGNTYPWGRELDCQKANYQNCVNQTSEVGSYPDGVSPYGAYDMTGNVWEWVSDWYSDNYYSKSDASNPTGPISGQSRVLRGGSWPRFDVTAYHRNKFAPSYNTFDIGFRCAHSASE
ncbi:MAG TPA: SUMF1/EgtB/PvdO family nonheme iron enzyme [Anaerolineales bacterium]|nr:SUMF1/EgtB/PvdO family nonheme iron enzyme [Anaerolineales bacterium]